MSRFGVSHGSRDTTVANAGLSKIWLDMQLQLTGFVPQLEDTPKALLLNAFGVVGEKLRMPIPVQPQPFDSPARSASE
ncbi:hypothetical protein Pla52n_69470 [Stieleria varia]|uniref:Uncharacterized protein n=1 Tax=Stieleria varia TaxID=2528005 RepID=A0A5C5ZLC1_9BACT|nr:hypothetical protein Pla52n_69470 [Stieleria varia]